MIKVRRANVILDIDEAQKSEYLTKGFDVVNEEGKVLEEATMTNDVGALHKKLAEALEKIKALEKENAKLKGKIASKKESVDEGFEEIPEDEPINEKKSRKRIKE